MQASNIDNSLDPGMNITSIARNNLHESQPAKSIHLLDGCEQEII